MDSFTFIGRIFLRIGLTAPDRIGKGAFRLHHYHAFGLRIASEIELAELHPGHGPADVRITCRRSAGLTPDEEIELEARSGAVELRLEGIRYSVRDGATIDIVAPEQTAEMDVRIWLLGSVMAALLHQRSYLPLHANVVALADGGAAAFTGASGAGKSSIAAWMESREHRVLADDLCAIRIDGAGYPCVFEGIPRMKLWSDTLEAFGRSSDGLKKVASDLDKFHVPMSRSIEQGSLEPLSLERVYLLDRAPEGQHSRIVRLTGAEAARGVLANAFRWELGQMIQEPRAQFDQCLALARHARVFRVERRWGFESFEEDALAIERHLMAPLAELNVAGAA